MLNRLKLFRNVGLFDSVSPPTTLVLAPLTLAYAENGRGKTTLSAILRSLSTGSAPVIAERHRLGSAHPPHIVIDCDGASTPAIFENGHWNRTLPSMAVFDDTFVDENICSGLVVEAGHRQRLHEFILGAQGVALNRALQQAVDEIEECNRTLRARAEAIPNDEREGLSADAFCSLPNHPNIDNAIEEVERDLAAARAEDSIHLAQAFEPFLLPEIDIGWINRVIGTSFDELDRVAADRVRSHLATIGGDSEAWVADGMNRISNFDCPFCAQHLAGSSIIAHYRAYFGAAYEQFKSEINDAIQEFTRWHGGGADDEFNPMVSFERAIRTAGERRQFWSEFASIPEIDIDTAEIDRAWSSARAQVLGALRGKRAEPLTAFRLDSGAAASIGDYERLRQEVENLSDRLQTANETIAVVRERSTLGIFSTLLMDIRRLRASKVRYSATNISLCADYLAAKAAKVEAEERRDALRAQLNRHRETIFPTYQIAINDYLRRFNAGFRLSQITPQNTRGGSACTYNVLINNQPISVGSAAAPGTPSFRSSLSAGDRNTLALAFFFASLDQDPALATKVIVIDDPVSSLDEHRSLTTVQEIRRLAQRVQQVMVLSHNKPFLCNIWDGADTSSRVALEVARDGDGSTIRQWDVSRDMITEHDRRHTLLRDYLGAAPVDSREVSKALRPVLEAFVRIAYPAQYPAGSMLGHFCGLCEQRIGTANEILNQSDTQELRDLIEYANRFHHDTNPAWQSQHINDTELLNFVRRALAFTRR